MAGRSILMLVMIGLAAGQTASAQPPQDSPDDALVERFIAAQSSADDELPDTDEETIVRLTQLNPGRGDDVRSVVHALIACSNANMHWLDQRAIRTAARQLGTAKLNRLIRFYESNDFRRLSALIERENRGENLSQADAAERDRIRTSVPLDEFGNLYVAARFGPALLQDEEVVGRVLRCPLEADTAMARLGLRGRFSPD